MKANAHNSDATLSFRRTSDPTAALTTVVSAKGLPFAVELTARKVRPYLGLTRYDFITPALAVDADDFTLDPLP